MSRTIHTSFLAAAALFLYPHYAGAQAQPPGLPIFPSQPSVLDGIVVTPIRLSATIPIVEPTCGAHEILTFVETVKRRDYGNGNTSTSHIRRPVCLPDNTVGSPPTNPVGGGGGGANYSPTEIDLIDAVQYNEDSDTFTVTVRTREHNEHGTIRGSYTVEVDPSELDSTLAQHPLSAAARQDRDDSLAEQQATENNNDGGDNNDYNNTPCCGTLEEDSGVPDRPY